MIVVRSPLVQREEQMSTVVIGGTGFIGRALSGNFLIDSSR